ncbi:MAG: 4-hydroxy-3-methylbut-2-enyl diphosphate reductase [Thermomicrobiales bacterium]|nr:4-hydroxy-3-methylbut-2-enyl diphosphate reductase [Thermomicrobiales bacterium]
MRIILARPRGFCAGVNMAIDALEQTIEIVGAPVYVYHEIVHNKHVVDRFKAMGAVFVDSLAEVPQGQTVVFSAHGVSPALREEAQLRSLNIIDATCPLVTKVHSEAIRFARQGHTILLIGHGGHDEIIGTMGEAPDRMVLVQSEEEAERVQVDGEVSLAFLSQTTLSVDDANRIVARLRQRFPQIVAPPSEDICYATQNRQEAIRSIAPEADIALVIGSQNSSNSMRLREIAEELGVPAYLIDSAEEIDPAWLDGKSTVALTAGASAPEELVQECVSFLVERFGGKVEERAVRNEDMHFQLPAAVRRMQTAARMSATA